MCNSCSCPDPIKCSVRGCAPMGWCCPQCHCYSPIGNACSNKFEATKTREFLSLREILLAEETAESPF